MSTIPPPAYSEAEPSKTEAQTTSSTTQFQVQPVDMMSQQPAQLKLGGQPQPYVVQPQYMVQPVGQQPYMVQTYQPEGMMIAVRPPLLPRNLQPNDYLVITVIVAIACGILNLTSLFFSIPAIILSAMAFERRNAGSYAVAKQLGFAAIILDLLCVTWVMVGGVIAVGVLFACVNEVGICEGFFA